MVTGLGLEHEAMVERLLNRPQSGYISELLTRRAEVAEYINHNEIRLALMPAEYILVYYLNECYDSDHVRAEVQRETNGYQQLLECTYGQPHK